MENLEIIKIKNIKGIEYKEFNINAVANKPNILVAPNGFGKSSFATAFNSLNKNKIQLRESDYYCGNNENPPQITISYRDDAGETHELIADDSQNAIKDDISYFVINCRTEAKGIRTYKGGVSARIEIPESHYLLGIIYNEAMHWKEDADNITPIAVKLEHKVIQHIIRTLFRE